MMSKRQRNCMHPLLMALLVTATPVVAGLTAQDAATRIGDCPVFPANNVWNTPVADLPVDPMSDAYVKSIGAATTVHADFGSGPAAGAPIGIPYVIVPKDQTKVDIVLKGYADAPEPFAAGLGWQIG